MNTKKKETTGGRVKYERSSQVMGKGYSHQGKKLI